MQQAVASSADGGPGAVGQRPRPDISWSIFLEDQCTGWVDVECCVRLGYGKSCVDPAPGYVWEGSFVWLLGIFCLWSDSIHGDVVLMWSCQ